MAQFVGITRTPINTLMALVSNGDLYELTWTFEGGWGTKYIGNVISKKPEPFPKVIRAESEN
jgi:hypothetical protein